MPSRGVEVPKSIPWRPLATQSPSMATESRPQAAQQPTVEKIIPKSAESGVARTAKTSKSFVFLMFLYIFYRFPFWFQSPETYQKHLPGAPRRGPELSNGPLGPEKNSHGSKNRARDPGKGAPHRQESPNVISRLPKQRP